MIAHLVTPIGETDTVLLALADELVTAHAHYRDLLHDDTIQDDSPSFRQAEVRISALLLKLAATPAASPYGVATKTTVLLETLSSDPDAALMPDEMPLVHSVMDDIRRLMPAAMPTARVRGSTA